jgi:hypothetical protein
MHYIFFLALTLIYQSALACTKDIDCKGDRICVVDDQMGQRSCRAPKSIDNSTTQDTAFTPLSVSPDTKTRSFNVNLLGALQFGLTPTIEWGNDSTFLVRARLLNTGILSYVVAESDGAELAFGLGGSFQVRKYLGKGVQQGPYIGGGLELMYTKTENEDIYETYFLVPQVEGGVRWQSDGYFTAVGVFAGVSMPIKTIGYSEGENLITGGFIWDIGWRF